MSIDVAVVSVLILQRVHILFSGLGAHAALFDDDGLDGCMDILRHPGRIASHVHACAILHPVPECLRLLQHSVLYVNLAILIAGERGIEPSQMPL